MCGFGAWQPMSSFTFIIWKRATSTFYKISSFLFYRIKKSTQVCNSMRVSTWWPNLHFWVNYSFKMPQNVQYWVLQQPVLEVPHSITTQYSLWVSEYQHCIREWSWCIQESDAHAHTHFPPFFWQRSLHTNHNQHYQHQHRSYMLQPMRNRDKSAFPLQKPITRQINRTEWQHKQIHWDRELVCFQNRCVFF